MLTNNQKPIICGNDESLTILRNEFPQLEYKELPSYSVNYAHNPGYFAFKMLFHLPRFLKAKRKDKRAAAKLVKEIHPDFIISDNRYGFRHPKVHSVLISHQLLPLMPKNAKSVSGFIKKKIFKWLGAFDEVWVPDFEELPNLSGKLSHKTGFKGRITFCGPLSRFQNTEKQIHSHTFDILAIVSGPEPHRTYFEQYCKGIARKTGLKMCLIAGKPHENVSFEKENLTYYSHIETSEFENLILQSQFVFSRSGYSTIMDMFVMNKKTLFVPTPGQTEQEYLAEYNSENGLFYYFKPERDDFLKCLEKLKRQNPESRTYNNELLINAMNKMLAKMNPVSK